MPLAGRQLARFLSQIECTDSCWLWTGALNVNGYGRPSINNRKVYAHRIMYEQFVGPIPAGLEVDHTCHNGTGCPGGDSCDHRRCVNPAHLELVTRKENILRGEGPAAKGARATHCPHGHAYDESNTCISKQGTRICRRCNADRASANYYAQKAA